MPIRQTIKDGKSAYQYGTTGKKYTFNPNDKQSRKRAKEKAKRQGIAVQTNKNKKDK